jgi:hypothetical protein
MYALGAFLFIALFWTGLFALFGMSLKGAITLGVICALAAMLFLSLFVITKQSDIPEHEYREDE